jgi:hypothetical protein
LAAPENDPVLTPKTCNRGAGASMRSPVSVGFADGGVVTHKSLLPTEPSAPTWLDGAE